LSFDLAGSARGVDSNVLVNFGPLSTNIFLPSSQGYTLFNFNVTLSAPAQLSFQNVQTGDIGAILDNVSVISAVTAIPEPSPMALAGLGAIGFIAYARHRQRVAVR
jgi:hypothetical protein